MKKRKTERNPIGKKLLFLGLCAAVAGYCFYSDVISAFYAQYTVQVKLVSFLIIVFVFLFCPFQIGHVYRLTNNMNEMDVNGKYNYWMQLRNQMEVMERASKVMNGDQQLHARNVNGYKKRLLAAQQHWKCGHCHNLLDPAYEVDHIIALSEGGTNNDDNLICLCRNCHGKKTFTERA